MECVLTGPTGGTVEGEGYRLAEHENSRRDRHETKREKGQIIGRDVYGGG